MSVQLEEVIDAQMQHAGDVRALFVARQFCVPYHM